jgi:carboxyl-terminal processing protease
MVQFFSMLVRDMRRLVVTLSLACLLVGVPSGLRAQEAQQGKSEEDNGYSQISIFAKAIELIRQDYVDGSKTTYHDLITAAMKGMLSSLDPHSQFMDPDDFRDMQEDTRSRFNGLGVEVSMKNGLPTVVTAMEDTPAARAGILSGDQILKINGASTERMDLQDAINILRGPSGRRVTLTLLRPSTKEIKDYTLERAEIKVRSVKGARLLDAELSGPFKIGYIRLIQFNEPTAEELSKALDELQKEGMQALILDLRNNPGGLLTSAVDVCGQFLPPKSKVVSTQGRMASQQHDYSTSGAKKDRPNSHQRRQREWRGDRCRRAQGFASRHPCW